MSELKQGLLAAEIVALGLGVYLLVAARLRWGRRRVLDGTPARIVGVLLVSPWPLAQITRLLFGLASWDASKYVAAHEWPFLQGEILLIVGAAFFACAVTMYGSHEPGRPAAVLAPPLPAPAVFSPPPGEDEPREEEPPVLENQDVRVQSARQPAFENETVPPPLVPTSAESVPEAEAVVDAPAPSGEVARSSTDVPADVREFVKSAETIAAVPVPDVPPGQAPVGGVWSEEIQPAPKQLPGGPWALPAAETPQVEWEMGAPPASPRPTAADEQTRQRVLAAAAIAVLVVALAVWVSVWLAAKLSL